MSKLKEIINFLKKRNSKIFQLKKNIELTISEIKKKDFSFDLPFLEEGANLRLSDPLREA